MNEITKKKYQIYEQRVCDECHTKCFHVTHTHTCQSSSPKILYKINDSCVLLHTDDKESSTHQLGG